jgi:hypothetical protein
MKNTFIIYNSYVLKGTEVVELIGQREIKHSQAIREIDLLWDREY